MSYEASIVADSISPAGARITTFQLKYPRMVHAELMTHRAFSRNASSTRSIPTAKMIEWIERDPAMPVYWGKNQKGMQATQELTDREIAQCKQVWLQARDKAVAHAKVLMDGGVHKQIASRMLEPWAHINVVVTATHGGLANFFSLRCHPAAMPEIQKLAVMMARAYRDSTPARLEVGWWHLPYVDDEDLEAICILRRSVTEGRRPESDLRNFERSCIKVSTARCARVSFKTFDGRDTTFTEDVELHDRLEGNGHWSPPEHPAQCLANPRERSGNFVGWKQYRQTMATSVHTHFDFARLDEFGDRDFIV